VVRHVSSARDFTESRTHEASTTGVHGVTGTFVDTSSVQTLTNKTLTAPTINNPTLGGTVQGSATFDDSTTFTSGATFNSSTLVERALSTDNAYRARVTGDTNSRFVVDADGDMSWGPGNAVMDTNLYRLAANVLQTDDQLNVLGGMSIVRPASTNIALATSATGDTFGRFAIDADGDMAWGPGNAGTDIDLVRSGAGALQITGDLTVNQLTASGDVTGGDLVLTSQVINSYTPTVNGGGAVTWSTRTGWYWEMGDLVFMTAYLVPDVAGTGSSIVQVTAPTNIYRGTRQVMGLSSENAGVNGHGHVVSFTGSTGATWDRMRTYDGQNVVGSDLFSGGLIVVQGWYRKA
jgi:hypothetical protein